MCRRRPNERAALIRLGLFLAVCVLVLDQATKYWIVHVVMSPPRVIEVTSFFNIVMVWNKGASFGLFSTQSAWTQLILGSLAVGISIILTVWLSRTRSKWLGSALGLVIGGAIGNAIDRAIYRAVADFLDFHVSGYHWPSFNVADIAIFAGVVILLFDGLLTRQADNKLSK